MIKIILKLLKVSLSHHNMISKLESTMKSVLCGQNTHSIYTLNTRFTHSNVILVRKK